MRKTIEGVILGLLLAILAAGLWQKYHRGSGKAQAPMQAPKVAPLMAATPALDWRRLSSLTSEPLLNVQGSYFFPLYGAPGKDRRTVVSGVYSASQDFVHAVVVSQADWARMEKGFPPLAPGPELKAHEQFSFTAQPGLSAICFFQTPPKADLAQARSLAAALALALQNMVGAPAARVSMQLTVEDQIYGTEEQAANVEAAIRRRATETSKPAPDAAKQLFGAPIHLLPANPDPQNSEFGPPISTR